jgi:hypothetical protein
VFEESGEKVRGNRLLVAIVGLFLVDDRGCLGRCDRVTFFETVLGFPGSSAPLTIQ